MIKNIVTHCLLCVHKTKKKKINTFNLHNIVVYLNHAHVTDYNNLQKNGDDDDGGSLFF